MKEHAKKCKDFDCFLINNQQCKFCCKIFSSVGLLQIHLKKQTCIGQPQRFCQSCKYTYERSMTQAGFEKHVEKCEKLIQFVFEDEHDGFCCKFCNKKALKERAGALYPHLEKMHPRRIKVLWGDLFYSILSQVFLNQSIQF